MKEDSIKVCESLLGTCIDNLKTATRRLIAHDKLKAKLMDPTSKEGKALRKMKWLNEADDHKELNTYGSIQPHWKTIETAMEKAELGDNEIISYITLIPGELELMIDIDEIYLTFSSEENYYRLIDELKLKIEKE